MRPETCSSMDKKLAAIPFGTNSYQWGGENKTQAEEGKYMGAALGLAIILVYMLMAALFDNLMYPLVIMLSLPQAMVGALLGLMVAGHSLTDRKSTRLNSSHGYISHAVCCVEEQT